MSVIETVVRSIKGACVCNVSYESEAKNDIRKGATDGSDKVNPYWSEIKSIKKVVDNACMNLGVVYENAINKRLDKKGLEADFVAEAMKGKIDHIDSHKCLCQSTDRTKTYIKYMPLKSEKMTVKYVLDGKDITAELKSFKAIKKETSTQIEAGLTEVEIINWRTLNIENIKSLVIMRMAITGKIEQERESTKIEKVEVEALI